MPTGPFPVYIIKVKAFERDNESRNIFFFHVAEITLLRFEVVQLNHDARLNFKGEL